MMLKPPSLTIGIEEEYQIIDPATRELKSYITEILAEDVVLLGEVKPELHQSMVEVGTRVCRTPAEARAELIRLRGLVMGLAAYDASASAVIDVTALGSNPTTMRSFFSLMPSSYSNRRPTFAVRLRPRRQVSWANVPTKWFVYVAGVCSSIWIDVGVPSSKAASANPRSLAVCPDSSLAARV